MKRKLLFAALLLFVFGAGIATAGSINGNYNGNPIVKLLVSGKELTATDVPAQIVDGRTMVPLYMLQSLGVKLEWDPKTYSVAVEMPTRTVPVLTQSQLEELSKSVYMIYASTDDPNLMNQGSGFIIDGYMITAKHVAADSDYAKALINGSWQQANDYAFVGDADVMGFKVSGGNSLPYSTELPQIGDPVYSIGYPNQKLTITKGEVLEIWPANSILQRGNGIIQYTGNGITIRHTAKTDHGASGGVLLNGSGEIIGLNSSTIPIDGEIANLATSIQEVIEELKTP